MRLYSDLHLCRKNSQIFSVSADDSFLHTITVLLCLPLYFLAASEGYQIYAGIAISVIYSLLLYQYPPIFGNTNKLSTGTRSITNSIYTVIREVKKSTNEKFKKAWYSILAILNIAILGEGLYTTSCEAAFGSLLYANSIISMLVSRIVLIGWLIPSISKKMRKHLVDEDDQLDNNDLNSLIKKSEGVDMPKENKTSFWQINARIFNVWNIICFGLFLLMSIYYLIGVTNTYIKSIMDAASVHVLLFFYISLCLCNGMAVVQSIIKAKFIWHTKKQKIEQISKAMYGLKVMAISFGWIVASTINEIASISSLGGIIKSQSFIEVMLNALNIVSMVCMLTSICYSCMKQDKPKCELYDCAF
jgi:hypothetical protein